MHRENIRLVQDVYLYDGLRTDRTMAYHGLEVRLPFADTKFVELIASVDPQLRMPQ
jgi:asparagine synthase (glutamine-hydrolysing)